MIKEELISKQIKLPTTIRICDTGGNGRFDCSGNGRLDCNGNGKFDNNGNGKNWIKRKCDSVSVLKRNKRRVK